jgi:hypothetical protein
MRKEAAIFKLYPQITTIRGDEAFDAQDNPVAYDESAVIAMMNSDAYKDLRVAAYPPIVDQLDTLYHGGYDAWKATIKAVKDKYPKE